MTMVEHGKLTRPQLWMLGVSCLAVVLVIASMAALYTALPDIAIDTDATQSQMTWLVDGYTLALACLVLPAGSLGDRYGRRAVLVVGLAIFTVGSGLPLLLGTPNWIIAARVVAGVGAAFVMPSTLSLLTSGLPAGQRGRAVGLWAGVAGAGAMVGVLGSGLLLLWWSWESIFIGLTVVGAALLACAVTLPEYRAEQPPRMDPVGSVAVAVGIGLGVLAILEGPIRGWTEPLVLGAGAVAVLALIGFTLWELRSTHPLLDVRLFKDRGFASGSVSLTIQFMVTFGIFLIIIQYLQLVLDYSPLRASVATAPMMVPLMVFALIAPWIAGKVGLKAITVTGLLAMAAGFYFLRELHVGSGYSDLLWPLLVMSSGLGLCASPATVAIVNGTPADKQGVAAAVNDATREIGAALGIAVAGSLLAAGYARGMDPVLPQLPEAARGPAGDSLAGALEVGRQAGPLADPLVDAAKTAFLDGAEQASLVLAMITGAAAVLLLLWAPGRRRVAADTGAPALVETASDLLSGLR
ncbi:MFS transporter [Tomitella biformata]|uniref:MFS transporter n=1 Tax=Tomitella biformata TaxID=630403 RepID=UPI000466E1FA|nr:MFS transporter [Tomitella biformata]